MLERARNPVVGDNIKTHMVLDYDLWRSMAGLIEMIKTPLQWEKVDSHIEGRVFKDGMKPKGNEFSIRLNTVVDGWAGIAREQHRGEYPQHLYPESGVMVQRANKFFINGKVGEVVTQT